MSFDNKKTKEELLERGFIEVGTFNGLECVARLVDNGEYESFAYHLLINNETVWDYAKNSNLNELNILNSIKDKLFINR